MSEEERVRSEDVLASAETRLDGASPDERIEGAEGAMPEVLEGMESDVAGPDGTPPDATAPDAPSCPPLSARRRKTPGRRLVRPEEAEPRRTISPQQRLLLLDSWRRSGLPAGDFAALVGMSKHTLYAWKKAFDAQSRRPAATSPDAARIQELESRLREVELERQALRVQLDLAHIRAVGRVPAGSSKKPHGVS